MNEMAMVEYLLKKYALLLYKADNAPRADLIYYLYGKAEQVKAACPPLVSWQDKRQR